MTQLNGAPLDSGSLNTSITGTNPFLGGKGSAAQEPTSESVGQPVAETWQADQYYRGPARPQANHPQAHYPHLAHSYAGSGGPAQSPLDQGASYLSGLNSPDAIHPMAVLAAVLTFFIPPVGVICSHYALVKIKASGQPGRGLAIGALVVGYFFTLGSLLAIVAGILWLK